MRRLALWPASPALAARSFGAAWIQAAHGRAVATDCVCTCGQAHGRSRLGEASWRIGGAPEERQAALVMRGFGRVRGEIPLIYLARVSDSDDGEPLGYRQMVGADLLFNEQQEECYGSLPHSFTFKEAKLAYGRADQPTRDFLKKCISIGVLRRPGKGQYEKGM